MFLLPFLHFHSRGGSARAAPFSVYTLPDKENLHVPNPALLKLVTTANSLMIGVMAIAILACLAAILAVLCLVLVRLWQIFRRPPVEGEMVNEPETDVIEGVFVDAGTLALSRRAYTR